MGSRYSPRRRETLPPVKHFVKSKMPFIQREVRPVLLAQDAGKTVADQEDLQSRFSSLSFLMIIVLVVNKLLSRILANIMDQLGDLGRHAVDIMDGIGLELCTYPTTRIPNSSVTQKVSVCLSRKR